MTGAPMTPERMERLQALFELALNQPADELAPFLAAQAPGDAELQSEVVELVRVHRSGRQLTGRSPASRPDPVEPPVARVGPWSITRLIGSGGMGSVYEAVRDDDQFNKRVAVKFLHRGAHDEIAVARFRAERQILATLNHPNVAVLLDGGVTSGGQPYLVMEYVDGQPITSYCDERRLPIAERLRLFLQVASAVESAHRSLVVHRDLKPGNILVTADGQVKLLDFGIARLLTTDQQPDNPLTLAGHRSFTPEYASPEQVRGLPVTTTADVYALGVVLFELLTGRRPFDLRGKLLAEVELIVCGMEPPRPSSLIDEGAAAQLGLRSAARARAQVAGDLDAIVLMALRKEPERRYGLVNLLAEDVKRHLEGRPVIARPEGVGYRLRKLVQRRKLETSAIALAVLSLFGGLVATTLQARRARAQGERATQVTSFLTNMLGAADPGSLGPDVKVREVLDSAAVRAASLGNNPALESEVRTVIGNTYLALGEYDLAEAQFRLDLAARARAVPKGNFAMGSAISRLALSYEQRGQWVVADSIYDQAAQVFRRYPPPDAVEAASVIEDRARVLNVLGRHGEAAALLLEAIDLQQRAGAVDSSIAYTYGNAGTALSDANNHVAADTMLRLANEAAVRAYGREHPLVAATLSMRASVLERLDRMDEADSLFRAALALRREVQGPTHPEYAWSLANYSDHLMRAQRWPESAAAAREVLALRGNTLEDSHPAVTQSLQTLGISLARRDSAALGEKYLRESVALRHKYFPAGHWAIASSENFLGEGLVLAGRYAEAESLLLPSERYLLEKRGLKGQSVATARRRLVMLYERWGKDSLAGRWRMGLDSSLATGVS